MADFGDWLGNWAGGFGGGLSDAAYSLPSGGMGGGFSPSMDTSWLSGFSGGPPAAESGGGSWLSNLGSGIKDMGIGDWAKAAGTAAQLGTTGLGIYGGIKSQQQGAEQMKVLQQEQKRQQEMAAPAAASGGALTAAGSAALTGGALPPALEAQVEDWKNQSRMRYRQQLAASGITDSSMAGQLEGWIELQAQKMRGELAGNLYGQGLQGIHTAQGPSAVASQTALGMAGGTQGSLQSANAALAKLLGSQ